MRFPIAARLFLAAVLAASAVAAIELALVRRALFEPGAAPASQAESPAIGLLLEDLSARYAQQGGWQFLPADPDRRQRWLREEWTRLQATPDGSAAAREALPLLGYRIGLRDRDGHGLAGVFASRPLIAFAQIDTRERPILAGGSTVGSLVEARPRGVADELSVVFLINQQQGLLAAAAAAVLLSALAALLLAAHFRRPIRRLVEGSQRLRDGRFDTRLSEVRSDELGELAATFNRMAAALGAAEQSRRQWVADTSHELRTPLAILRGQLEALQDGVRASTPENLSIMSRQVQALSRIVDELYQLASADVGQLECRIESLEIRPLVCDVAEGFRDRIQAAGLHLERIGIPDRALAQGDEARLRQVFTNLLENCVRYTAPGGRIEIGGSRVGGELRITVADSAPGVPAALMPQLGERFFRAEASRNRRSGGTGLGLALSRKLVELQGGRLEFAASVLGGLQATVVLKAGMTA